jgi:hypothetical protein
MKTFREWMKRRPGKNSSLGKAGGPGSRGGQGARKQVRLPIECPHCHHEITAEDMGYESDHDPLRTTRGPEKVQGSRKRRAVTA